MGGFDPYLPGEQRSPSVMFAQRRLAEKDTDTLMDLLDGKAGNAFLNNPVPIFMRTRFLQPLRSALVKKASIGKCTTICSAKSPRPKMKFRRLVRARECADSATGPSRADWWPATVTASQALH